MSFFDLKNNDEKIKKESILSRKNDLFIYEFSKPLKAQKRISSELSASATVEAAMIFPLIIFFFMSIIWFMNLYYIHSEVGARLNLIGNEMVSLSYPYHIFINGDDNKDIKDLIISVGWSELYVKSELQKLDVYDRIESMTTLLSDFLAEDAIDIVVTYSIQPIIPIPGIPEVILCNHFYSKMYTGYSGKETSVDKTVYITKSGSVYHTDLECRALKCDIHRVRFSSLDTIRNLDGSKYYPCKKCQNTGFDNTVYITDYGNRYHSTGRCSELKLDIFEVPLSLVNGRHKCRFCGN